MNKPILAKFPVQDRIPGGSPILRRAASHASGLRPGASGRRHWVWLLSQNRLLKRITVALAVQKRKQVNAVAMAGNLLP
jgi:hypothetical protein